MARPRLRHQFQRQVFLSLIVCALICITSVHSGKAPGKSKKLPKGGGSKQPSNATAAAEAPAPLQPSSESVTAASGTGITASPPPTEAPVPKNKKVAVKTWKKPKAPPTVVKVPKPVKKSPAVKQPTAKVPAAKPPAVKKTAPPKPKVPVPKPGAKQPGAKAPTAKKPGWWRKPGKQPVPSPRPSPLPVPSPVVKSPAPVPKSPAPVPKSPAPVPKSPGKKQPIPKPKRPAPKPVPKPVPKPSPSPQPVPKPSPSPLPKPSPSPLPKPSPSPLPKPSPSPKPPPSPDNSVYSSTPTSEADRAAKRVQFFVKFMKTKGKYNTFLNYFTSTGLNDTMVRLLPYFSTTILMPTDKAFSEIPAEERSIIFSQDMYILQVMAFHIWFPGFFGKDLNSHPMGTTYSTADFPQKNIVCYKLNITDHVEFNGRPDDTDGAALEDHDMYYDAGTTFLVAHGLDKVMTPLKLFKA